MKKFIFSILICLPFLSFSQLTGYWKTDKGHCYEIKQDGNMVYWAAKWASSDKTYNVFSGELFGSTITGRWCDLPSYTQGTYCDEQLLLRVEGNNRIVKVFSSRPYASSVWERSDASCVEGNVTQGNTTGLVNRCFSDFIDKAIKDKNEKRFSKLSLQECAEKCVSFPWCISFDYNRSDKRCYLAKYGKDAPGVKFIDKSGWTFYQIKYPGCN